MEVIEDPRKIARTFFGGGNNERRAWVHRNCFAPQSIERRAKEIQSFRRAPKKIESFFRLTPFFIGDILVNVFQLADALC
jgi:hypothetical protein